MKRFVLTVGPFLVAAVLVVMAMACNSGGPSGPVVEAWEPPRNPHLADSAWAIYHHDSYAQHFSTLPAVEGRGEVTTSVVQLDGIPIFVLFDPDEDILAVTKRISGASLWKIDRETLAPLASVDLTAPGTVFSGMYGYVDAEGRSVLGVGTQVVRFRSQGNTLEPDGAADLASVLEPGDALVAISVLYSGEIVFLSDQGVVGVIAADLVSAPLATLDLGEVQTSNGMSVDETGGIFIVSSGGMHRVDWNGATLTEGWFHEVEASSVTPRPGRLGTGSGTTPALMKTEHVVIADDAESMNLLVLRRGGDLATGTPRETCKIPAFDGPSTTDNAIVVAGNTMIVEQNLEGYRGVARIDLLEDGSCERIWFADVRAPTCVPTLSTETGLVYVYAEEDAEWGLTGLDARDGSIAFRAVAGVGGTWDNYYSAVTIGPDARVYVGTLNGLVVFADAE